MHLIAAAPDLYAALKELLRVVDGTLQGYGILEAPIQCARAALAKARKSVTQTQPTAKEPGTGSQEKR
jgi:hypothetical protein